MNWISSLDQAKEESLKTHKPILLLFEMNNCGGCKKFAETTFQDSKVIEDMKNGLFC